MMAYLKRTFKTAWQGMKRNNWLTIACIAMMVLSLLIFSSIIIFNYAANSLVATLKQKMDISIYFKTDVPEVLKLVNLQNKANNFPYQMSAGEKQRTVIARALIQRPELILADEPTGNLDPINSWDIIKLLVKINELGTAVMLATHDKEIVNTLGKRVISLENGKVIRDEQEGKYLI